MLTITGTPVVYYGDEFGKFNDEKYYNEQIKHTGKDDTRFLVRGRIEWQQVEKDIKQPENFHAIVFNLIHGMLNARKNHPAFGRGKTTFVTVSDQNGNQLDQVLAYYRISEKERILVINNLSDSEVRLNNPVADEDVAILYPKGMRVEDPDNAIILEPFGFAWLLLLD